MKHPISRILSLSLLLITAIPSYAYNFERNGLCYHILSETDRTVEVTYKSQDSSQERYVSGSLEIPPKVTYKSKTYRVVAIGYFAFNCCRNLTSVSIPNSVITIDDYAFYACKELTSVSIPNSVITIGDQAFMSCYKLTSVSIPNSVTKIGYGPFAYCNLTSISVDPANPNYKSIDGVLYDKHVTKLVQFPGGKKAVSIPNSVTSIGSEAFAGCELTSVSIPNSVTSIEREAFAECGLTSVFIPNSVTSIGDGAFWSRINLKSIYCQATTPPTCDGSIVREDGLEVTKLYVPIGAKASYEAVDPWRNFWYIEEYDFSGIDDTIDDNDGLQVTVTDGIVSITGMTDNLQVAVYDMQGRTIHNSTENTISNLAPGIYIAKCGSKTIKFTI